MAAVILLSAGEARAQPFDDDVRLRIGGYFPADLPTSQGTLWGIEVRNLLDARNGMAYGVYFFAEQRTEFVDLNFGGGPVTFTFHADIKIQPLLISWFHIWPRARVTCFAGAGLGIYAVEAFSGGFSKRAGVQISDVGDFRALEDAVHLGAHVYGGVDFLPDARWGASLEARAHLVEAGFSATEISAAGIFRF